MRHGSLESGIGMLINNGVKCQPYLLHLSMGQKRNPVYDKAYQLYLTGLSLQQVADNIGVTRQCVYKAFKKRGFALRGPNFQPIQEFDGKKFTLRNTGYFGSTTNERTLLHRYKWEYYNGKIPKGWDIHHKDENKWNNEISNFECLPKADHARIYTKRTGSIKVKCVQTGIVYNSLREAMDKTGIHRISIGRVCKRKQKTAGGFIWIYVK